MLHQMFEIKVALLGNVSAGKTTVLNALLRDRFGEVAMKRTTAGVNYFSVFPKNVNKDEGFKEEESNVASVTTANESKTCPITNITSTDDYIPHEPENPRSAESIFKEISADNQNNIHKNGSMVLEKFFQIEVDSPLVNGRNDTTIVLVDIPGINEAGNDSKYKNYVEKQWSTFDCVVIVMDAKQGVNTDDQVFLLHFVKKCNDTVKNIPVIVLCNKVDDPSDQEVSELVMEARNEVSKVVGTQCTFIAISALQAYTYLCISNMTLEQFELFDKELIEKVGKEHLGRQRWNKMSNVEKIYETFKIVSDEETFAQGLHESRFDLFLSELNRIAGDEDKQTNLILHQISTSIKAMSIQPFEAWKIMKEFVQAYSTLRYLQTASGRNSRCESSENCPVSTILKELDDKQHELMLGFRCACELYQKSAFAEFKSIWPDVGAVKLLAGPVDILSQYCNFLSKTNQDYNDEYMKPVQMVKDLIQNIIHFLYCEYLKQPILKDFAMTKVDANVEAVNEKFLNHVEWSLIWDSFLLMYYDKNICLEFGREKFLIENVASKCRSYLVRPCPFCCKSLHSNSKLESNKSPVISFCTPTRVPVPSNASAFPSSTSGFSFCSSAAPSKPPKPDFSSLAFSCKELSSGGFLSKASAAPSTNGFIVPKAPSSSQAFSSKEFPSSGGFIFTASAAPSTNGFIVPKAASSSQAFSSNEFPSSSGFIAPTTVSSSQAFSSNKIVSRTRSKDWVSPDRTSGRSGANSLAGTYSSSTGVILSEQKPDHVASEITFLTCDSCMIHIIGSKSEHKAKATDDDKWSLVIYPPLYHTVEWLCQNSGKVIPVDSVTKLPASRFEVPESVCDPSHFGYLLFKFSELKELLVQR